MSVQDACHASGEDWASRHAPRISADHCVYKKTTVFEESPLDSSSSPLILVSRVKKSLQNFSLFFVFNIDFTVEMASKTKHAISSSSAVAPEVQTGGPSTQEALILGNKTI